MESAEWEDERGIGTIQRELLIVSSAHFEKLDAYEMAKKKEEWDEMMA